MSKVRERKVGERGIKEYEVLFIGGSKHGTTEWIEYSRLIVKLEHLVPIPNKFGKTIYDYGQLPSLSDPSYKVERYIRKTDFGKWYYVEEELVRRQRKEDRIRYLQKQITKHLEEITKLKMSL